MDGGGVRSESKKMKYEEFEEQRAKPCEFGLEGKPQEIESKKICGKPRGFGLDLNTEDVSSSFNHDPFHPSKNYERVQARDAFSECGSTCGSGGEKDSMRIWKEMKQNGFLSSSHGGVLVPPMPKPRGRSKGNESVIKRKIEIAKREQVNRFAKIAAPSGLLNELNPGIINHVRNSRQVHSIIENLVRSARNKDNNGGSKQDDGTSNHSFGGQLASSCRSDELTGDGSGLAERDVFAKRKTTYHPSYHNKEGEDDVLALKLSSASTMASENISSLSNQESANTSTVDSLSVKAASVASQWLELVHQDIKGRLAALRRSKKRVRAVTQTELPFLISKELSSNQENDPCAVISSNKVNNDMHKCRWTALFDQMDKSLSEEEKHLESSLTQVREMLLHCEHGLLQFHPANGLQQPATLQNDYLFLKAEPALDKDLAIRAAAAAIYSTSNFLQSAENLPCF